MEFIVIWFIIVIVINVVKKKATSEKKDTYGRQTRGGFGNGSSRSNPNMGNRTQSMADRTRNKKAQSGVNRGFTQSRRPSSAGKQESWRNTAEVNGAAISFRGLREGEDELAYLIHRNTAYEKRLEARLVSREH